MLGCRIGEASHPRLFVYTGSWCAVAWPPGDKSLISEDYLLYVQTESSRRQGGGNDLGLAGAEQIEYSAPKAGTRCLF